MCLPSTECPHATHAQKNYTAGLWLPIVRRCVLLLILYGVPSPVSYNIRMHKGIEKLAEENGVAFLDGNSDTDNLHIDWEKDTFDEGDHLNLFGSAKMTDYLAQYMISNCDLPDHRDDPAFRSWDELIPAYEQEIKDMEGTGYPEIEKRRKKEK